MQEIGIVGSRETEDRRPKTEVGSRKLEVRSRETEDRSRHGPSTRGDPDIRGKPTMGIGVSNSNITDLESPPPDTVISTKERSLSNEVVFDNMRFRNKFGMTVRGKPPFKDCASTKMREYINVPIRGKPPLVWCRCVLIRGKPPLDIASQQRGFVISAFSVISTKERSLSNEVAVNNMRFLSYFLRSPLGGNPSTDGKGARNWLHRESRVLTAKKSVGFFGVFIPNGDYFAEKGEAPPNLPSTDGKEQEKREGGRLEKVAVISRSWQNGCRGFRTAITDVRNACLTAVREFAPPEIRKLPREIGISLRSTVAVSAPTGRNLIAQGAALCNWHEIPGRARNDSNWQDNASSGSEPLDAYYATKTVDILTNDN